MKPNSTPVIGRPPIEEEIVVDAAIRCFENSGTHRTSIADIAEEAGISRKTVYRLFEDRSKLIERVLLKRFAIIGKLMAEHVRSIENPREAMIEGLLISAKLARKDRLFNQIVRKDTTHRIEQIIVRGDENMVRLGIEFWSPIFDKGRQADLIKQGMSDDQIFEFMMSIHALLMMRSDPNEQIQREFLIDLLNGVLKS